MAFDHRLKKGPSTTRNAIKILTMFSYPEEITKEASRLAENFNSKNPIDIQNKPFM